MTGPDLSVRGPATLGVLAALALVIGFGLWATTTRISGAVIAPGRVEVEANRQVVQHPDGGVVEAILVGEGDRVAAGQPLLRLDGAPLRSDLAIVEGQLSELSARTARLVAERDDLPAPVFPAELLDLASHSPEVAAQIDGQRRLFDARHRTFLQDRALLERRVDQIRAQTRGLRAQETALAAQLSLIERELDAQQSLLDKGLAQSAVVLALQREAARLTGQLGAVAADLAQAEGHITEIEIETAALASRRSEAATTELRDIGPLIQELAERKRALALRIARLEIRSPVAGLVLGLQVTAVQSVLRPADPVLYIVPQDRPLVISARISPTNIDEVRVGQPAELVFPAFPARDTPHLAGRLTLLSADVLADTRTGSSYFAARVELTPGEAARLADRALVPGMPVEVFLQTGDRTAFEWLVKPFTDYFSHAFRES